ncbi:glutamate--cysteine ligase catalytic subunit [Nematocida sp. AWRm80]|nr:glutamate--cysteine ligase catalytic subunit [Nematocida sp. AWRm80]
MGLLKESTTLSWTETQKQSEELKREGIQYFIEVYKRTLPVRTHGFLWGEEIEQNLVCKLDGNWSLALATDLVIEALKEDKDYLMNIEYAGYMLESTPREPYEPKFKVFKKVEENMEKRRKAVQAVLNQLFNGASSILYLPSFPLLGTPFAFGTGTATGKGKEKKWKEMWISQFKKTPQKGNMPEFIPAIKCSTAIETVVARAKNPTFNVTRSIHFPDFAITPHRRFHNFTYNIRERKERPLHMEIPAAKIEKTMAISASASKESTEDNHSKQPSSFYGSIIANTAEAIHLSNPSTEKSILPSTKDDSRAHSNKNLEDSAAEECKLTVDDTNTAIINSMGQGMGCCCLQITMQCESLSEARLLYDNLGAICPLLLFLTMATPIVNGILTESSTRWDIVSASVDCRKDSELEYIKKSRYSSIDLYTSDLPDDLYALYNDINPYLDPKTLKTLLDNQVDRAMANHIASLYIRDPVLCYSTSTAQEKFENIQSSNWRSMRLKSPKASASESSESIGWMVEVRPMEIQPTSFENTVYSVFVILFSRMVLSLNTCFYLPISKVDANFISANYPTTTPTSLSGYLSLEQEQQFWYRENIFSQEPPVIKKGTIKDIFLGTETYCGLIPAIEKYLEEYSEQDKKDILPYLQFIKDRASGKKSSVATFIRRFVSSHPEYNGDSLINQSISNDLIERILSITALNSPEYLSFFPNDSNIHQ